MNKHVSEKIIKYSEQAIIDSQSFLNQLNLDKEQKETLIYASQMGTFAFLEEIVYINETPGLREKLKSMNTNKLFLYSLAYSLQIQNRLSELISQDEDLKHLDL